MINTSGRFPLLALVLVLFSISPAQSQNPPTPDGRHLAVGDPAPDFSLPCATKDSIWGEELRLSEVVGSQKIILAFYPADWSGGCTKEVCSFRDNFSSLSGLNARVLAVSGDYVYSHHEWAKALSLPFFLLSDHLHSVARLYESFNPATGFNRRTVYVVDSRGIIQYIDPEYRVRDDISFNKLSEALKKID
jgi:peroxiredoxin Q/BCP